MVPSDPLVDQSNYVCLNCGKIAGGATVFSMLKTLEEEDEAQTAYQLEVRGYIR
jgi:uncharacterized protein YegJ (DUF2314 family)